MSATGSAGAMPGAKGGARPAADGSRAAHAMLEARDVCFSWPGNRVLDGFSLVVERGSVVCLMGTNGCGKSTFIDCVLGDNRLASGSISIDGRDADGLAAAERAQLVAFVPQVHERTFPYAVEHMVMMGRTSYLSPMGTPGDEDRAIVADALSTCGIAHLADRVCTELSGGEMQMVLLARALAQDAPLIVLDEPTAHLDFRNELVFLEAVEQLARRRGTTVLMATHSPNQAFHLSVAGLDVRVALMRGGRVAFFGEPDEVLVPELIEQVYGIDARLCRVDVARGDEIVAMRQLVCVGTVPADSG